MGVSTSAPAHAIVPSPQVKLSLVFHVHIHYSGLVDLMVKALVSNCANGYIVPPLCMTQYIRTSDEWGDFSNFMVTHFPELLVYLKRTVYNHATSLLALQECNF